MKSLPEDREKPAPRGRTPPPRQAVTQLPSPPPRSSSSRRSSQGGSEAALPQYSVPENHVLPSDSHTPYVAPNRATGPLIHPERLAAASGDAPAPPATRDRRERDPRAEKEHVPITSRLGPARGPNRERVDRRTRRNEDEEMVGRDSQSDRVEREKGEGRQGRREERGGKRKVEEEANDVGVEPESKRRNNGKEKEPKAEINGDDNAPSSAPAPAPQRYFVMKAANEEDLKESQQARIWSVHPKFQERLSKAFKDSDVVTLIFMVNHSRFFYGYAEMTSDIGKAEDSPWSVRNGAAGTAFSVRWSKTVKAPFGMTMKIHDRYNHNQVVKLSENGMEMHPDAGRALCDVMDEIEEDQGRESRRAPPSQRRASPTRKRSRSPDGPTTPPPVGERPKRRLSEREGIEMMHPARRALAGGDDRPMGPLPPPRERRGPPLMRGHPRDDRMPPPGHWLPPPDAVIDMPMIPPPYPPRSPPFGPRGPPMHGPPRGFHPYGPPIPPHPFMGPPPRGGGRGRR